MNQLERQRAMLRQKYGQQAKQPVTAEEIRAQAQRVLAELNKLEAELATLGSAMKAATTQPTQPPIRPEVAELSKHASLMWDVRWAKRQADIFAGNVALYPPEDQP
jgi:hypothetical protein